jgi:hypothetical protein
MPWTSLWPLAAARQETLERVCRCVRSSNSIASTAESADSTFLKI